MAGPGGGSRGGGFGGGSFGGGGGRGPGGFGGGHYGHHGHHGYHGHHRHFHYGPMFFPFFGPRYYWGGGFFGIFFAPFILLMIVAMTFMSMFATTAVILSNGVQVQYNESDFQDYANAQYYREFGNSTAQEDNILLIFLTNEEADGYYTIAWIGDNVTTRINEMFGNEYTEFGYKMKGSIASYYKNSLSKNLATVVNGMTDSISNLKLKSSFDRDYGSPSGYVSHVTNNSSLELNEDTINRALEDFTAETDIPIVIVVDDMEDVFGKTVFGTDIMTIVACLALGGAAIYFIYRSVKDKKPEGTE